MLKNKLHSVFWLRGLISQADFANNLSTSAIPAPPIEPSHLRASCSPRLGANQLASKRSCWSAALDTATVSALRLQAPRPQPQIVWPSYETSGEDDIRPGSSIAQMESIKKFISYLISLEWTEQVQHVCKFCDRTNFTSIVYEVSCSILCSKWSRHLWLTMIYRTRIWLQLTIFGLRASFIGLLYQRSMLLVILRV